MKGYYLKYLGKIDCSSLIYPVPHKDLKGLGIHTSFDSDGSIRFGPNTFEVGQVSYDMENEGIKEEMKKSILKKYKNIDEEKLCLDYAGIRSKIKRNGQYYSDFWIKGPKEIKIPGYFELCGIESPGFTGSPAIAKYLAIKIMDECLDT